MSASAIEFDLRELHDELESLLGRSYNMADANSQIADVLLRFVDDKFENEGPGWPPLSARTLASRRSGGVGAKMLHDTGVLVNSISAYSGADFVEIFTNVPYSEFHLTGTKHMPARDFFNVDLERVADQAAEIILSDIVRSRG